MSQVVADGLEFQRNGFVLVRDVFTESEVARMRAAVKRHAEDALALGRILPRRTDEIIPVGDLLDYAGVDVVFDERLLSIARSLLGERELVYFGDSGLMVGGSLRGFHKDNACRDDATHPDWTTPYTLLRMGIYLEDHSEHSGGVKVRRGSHLCADITTGEIIDVPSRPGDVVVWSLRTTHSGFAVRVRTLPWVHLQPRMEVRLPKPLIVHEPCERLALFVTYGLDDAHLATYVAKHTDREAYPDNYLFKSWLYSSPDPKWEAIARSRGCKMLRPIPEYGVHFGSRERTPLGFIPVGSSAPDRYPARGMEAVFQGLGKVVRTVTGQAR